MGLAGIAIVVIALLVVAGCVGYGIYLSLARLLGFIASVYRELLAR